MCGCNQLLYYYFVTLVDNGNDDDLMAFEELHKAKLRVAELEEKLLKKKMLHFNVDHFFAVGSPLGIFIILKEHDNHVVRDYKCAKSFLPSSVCGRIHNLHHPSDPVVSHIPLLLLLLLLIIIIIINYYYYYYYRHIVLNHLLTLCILK